MRAGPFCDVAPASWANELTIGQALASVGAPHSACPSGFLSPRSRSPGIACRMFNTSWAKVPQIRIDALPQRFRLFVGSLAHGSATAAMQLQQRIRLRRDEGPVPKLAGRPLQLGLRVHHDRRRVPEAVFLRRAETGFLLLRPGPLPRRHCRRERASDCRCARGSGLCCHRFPFRSGYRRTAPMRIRVTCGSHRDVRSSSALPQ